MVAIVTGKGAGLERSSAYVLGSQGQLGSALLGRDGEGVFVNAANGNLVITRQDEFLIGLGPDISASRTYNSQGMADGDNDDGWRAGAYRTVTNLTGTYGASGSTVTRTDWDGSATVYTWDAAYVAADGATGAYVAKDGPGAYDTLTRSGTTWTWTDGSTLLRETYESSNGGRIATASDTDGNLVDYAFDGNGRIATVTSRNASGTGDDEVVTYSYTGANLAQITTSKNGGTSLTRVRYAYETYDGGAKTRLVSVTIDLSPDNNSVSDNYSYTTTYAYRDASSALVTSIRQSDGSRLDIEYDASNRVVLYAQTIAAGVVRQTSFDYADSGRTIVTDPAGQKTVMVYDATTGDLKQITYPPESANVPARTVQFLYNANGDVTQVVSGPGNTITYEYDGHGNRTLERDGAGNTVTRTFNTQNRLLTETRYLVADPDGAGSGTPSTPLTTHYVYSATESHLRFVITAEGNVTEYLYDSNSTDDSVTSGPGLVTSVIAYTANTYTGSSFEIGDLQTWSAGISDKRTAQRTHTEYDFRGNVTKVTSWSNLNNNGTFDETGGSQKTETNYVYDQAGNLLQRIVANPASTGNLTETFVYDGLNRMTLATDFYGKVTRTTFLDQSSQTVVTHANGLSQVTTFNRGGEIISASTSNVGANLIDLSGWPANASNVPAGDATVPGWLNLANFVDETKWETITGPDGTPVVAMRAGQTDTTEEGGGNYTNTFTIDASKAYEFTYYFRLSDLDKHSIYFGLSGWGATAWVENADGSDQNNPYFAAIGFGAQAPTLAANTWYKVVGYVLPQGAAAPAAPLGGIYNAETGQKVADALSFRWNPERPDNQVYSRFYDYYGQADQQYSTYFYKPEVRQVTVPGVPAPDTQTTQYRYDNLGRLRLTIDPTGRRQFFLYDTVGRRVADIDNDGTVTEYRYDGNDNLTSTTRYNTRLTATQLDNLEWTDQAVTLKPTASSMVGNGSFEASNSSYTTTANGRRNPALPGWTDANGRPLEQIASGQLGVNASDGAYWLDLDSLASTGYTVTGSNLLSNNSFDTSGVYTTIPDGRRNPTLPGWTDANGNAFEQITSGQVGVTGTNGAYWLDMDSYALTGYAASGSNLLSNGSFDTSGGTYTTSADGRRNTSLPGWTDANGRPLEQIISGHLGVTGTDGAYWLDMDSLASSGYVATGSNLLTNGSFETSGGTYTTLATGRSNSTLPGWTDANGLEFQQVTSGERGITASDGSYWLDLEAAIGVGDGGGPSVGPNLIANGSFEDTDWYGNLADWTVPDNFRIARVLSGDLGVDASEGDYWLDLEGWSFINPVEFGTPLPTPMVSQTIGSLTGGQILNLSFDHANRTGTSSGNFQVYWNGDLVAEIASTGSTMETENFQVVAQEGDNILSFVPTDGLEGDLEGASIDNVQLYATGNGGGNMDISQTITGRTAGEVMQIQFDAINRTTVTSGTFRVYWNDTLVDTVSLTGSTLGARAYQVTALAGNNTLRFVGLGTVDGAGGSIDNVRVFATTPSTTGGNNDISQTITGRTAGEMMQIQFDTANRTTSGSGSFEVYWNGTLVDTVTSTGTTMTAKTYQVVAVAGNNVLRFKGTGTADGSGASIDNVRLFATTPVYSGGNMDISQTVSGRTAGEMMQIQFDTANRTTSGSGSVEVYWNGTLVDTVTSTGTTMTTKSYQVAAVAGDNVLRFKGTGTVDGTGASLDNVGLFATTPSTSGGNNDISQSIGGLIAGQTMQLKFDHANRTTSGSGSFEVYWNGAPVATIDSTGTTMVTETLTLTAIAGTNTLRFKGIGTADGDGASLDNVRLVAMQEISGPLLGLADIRPATDAANDVWTFNVYDNAQRLVQTIDGLGATTTYQYDGASRPVSTTQYAGRVSSTNIATLKAREINPNLWANFNGLDWVRSNANVATAGTLDGSNAFQFSVATAGFDYVVGNTTTAAAGDVVTYTLLLKGVGTALNHMLGLYGGSSDWGANDNSSAVVTSGPGSLTQAAGGLWFLNGLSTTETTRITISRRYTQAEIAGAYFYVGDPNYTLNHAGDAVIMAAPVWTSRPTGPVFLPTADAANDRVNRSFYDNDGRLVGTLDGEGYLTKTVYDKAGRRIETIGYSGITSSTYRASGTFAQLLGSVTVDNSKDIHNWFVYDSRGLLRATIDGEGDLTRMSYNSSGDLSFTETGQKLDPATLIAAPPTLANLPAAPGGTVLQTVSLVRDAYGHVLSETRSLTGAGTATTNYTYDDMYRLTATTSQPGGADARVIRQRYDLRGNVIGTLNGIGSAALDALGGSPTQAQIDAVWANYGTTLTYDRADRLLSSTDPNGSRTVFYYDADGQLAFQVDAAGYASEYRYDALGRRTDVIAYGNRLSTGAVSGLTGGDATTALTSTIHGLGDSRYDKTVHLEFNLDGTLKQSADSLGSITAYSYDAFGAVVSRSDPFATGTTIVTNSGYDRRGLLKTQTVDPGSTIITTTYGYDAFGRPVTLTDAETGASTSEYDRVGRLTASTDAIGKTSRIKYDARGNVVWTKDAENNVTRYVYDEGGRRIWSVDAAGGVVKTSYDADGRALTVTAYATAISLSGFGDQVTDADVAGRVTADGTNDRIVRNAYDNDGRVRFTVDGVSALTEFVYDDAGNVIRTIQYGGALDTTTNYTIAYIDGKIASQGLAALPQTRTTFAVYDAVGRVAYSIGADGSVVQFSYENGGVTRQRAFAAKRDAADGIPSLTTMDSWVTVHAAATDHVTRALYDSEGRLAFSIDAGNFVTKYIYDKLDHVTKQVRYAGSYSITDTTTYASLDSLIGATIPSTAAVTEFKYDSAGRLKEIVDPLGMRTVMTLDKLGRVVTSTVAYGTAAASMTTYTYDAVGRVVTTRRQVDGNTAHDLVTTNTYDGVGNLVKVVDVVDSTVYATTYNYYDAVGHMVQQLDAEQFGTDYTFTVFGEVASVTRHAQRCNNAGSVSTTVRPTFTADPLDATTSFLYDRRGLLVRTTDALGNYELYGLDEFGNRTSVTNKAGHATTYTYDQLNRMLTETLPVDVIRASDGAVLATSVRNDFTYDAFGNLHTKIEAANRPVAEQRNTTYTYDKLNRVTLVEHDAVTVYSDTFGTTANVVPSESFAYDARGNVVLSVDAAGRQTFSYYDLADRKTDEVVALEVQAGPVTKGVMNHWEYDARGNVTLARIYSDLVTMPASVASAMPTPGTDFRQTSSTYDRMGRQLTSTLSGLRFGFYDGAGYQKDSSGSTTVTRTYDAFGNLLTEADGNGNVATTWYDRLGRKVAQIDRENYLTTWELDANGNTVAETRYASKITGSYSSATAASSLTALVTANTNYDRTTTFTYDKNGHRMSERRWYVQATSVSSGGTPTTSSQTAIIQYTYNALGLVASRTEANGVDVTDFTYDKIGRLKETQDPTITDYTGASVRRATGSFYDALGNVVRTEVNKVGGAAIDDHVTTYSYGQGGRLLSTTDAGGYTHEYGYDIAGRVKMDKWTRLKADGTTTLTEATSYRYDLAGRLITQANANYAAGSWTFGAATRLRYNAFGELTGRGLTAAPGDAAVYQETFDYDEGGRLWRTNSDNGSARIMFYDWAGNLTLTLSSVGANLGSTSYADAYASLTSTGGTTLTDAVTTIAVYDRRGQQTQTVEPGRKLQTGGSAQKLVTLRTYNAFGEVASEVDARGTVAGGNQSAYRTEFAYNTMGRLVQKTSPEVAWTGEDGVEHYANPVETYGYDLLGRLVAVTDANNHVTTRQLLAGTGLTKNEDPLVTAEFHPDGGIARSYYDVFGNLRIARNELYVSGATTDFDEVYGYDKLGRLTSVQHRGNLLTEYFGYDSRGQRTQRSNSFLTGITEQTDYDVMGRVVSQIDLGGDTTTYGYTWDANAATGGMATFGGWIKTTVNAAARQMTETLDYFGRTVGKSDYGSHVSSYTYDWAGRLTARSSTAGESMTFGWLNTGLAASVGFNGNSTTYAYDRAGNRTTEATTLGGVLVEDSTAGYDALNRMTSWSQSATASMPAASITTKYDLAGNVRMMHSVYATLDNEGAVASTGVTKDLWYLYDPMNRLTVSKGALGLATIDQGSDGLGVLIAYDKAGQRISETRTRTEHYDFDPGNGVIQHRTRLLDATDMYSYRADGFMTQNRRIEEGWALAEIDASDAVRATFTRDAMGRVTNYSEYDPTGANTLYSRATTYNNRSQVVSETSVRKVSESGGVATYTDVTTNHYNAKETFGGSGVWRGVKDGTSDAIGSVYMGGTVTYSETDSSKTGGSGGSVADTSIREYLRWWDGTKQTQTVHDRDLGNPGNSLWTTTYSYNGSGTLTQASIVDGKNRTINYLTDSNGMVLKRDVDYSGGGDPTDVRYIYAGVTMGVISNDGTDNVDFGATFLQHIINAAPNGVFRPNAGAYADFDQNYTAINGDNYDRAGSRYTAQQGDTLQSIAQSVWGDANLWYLLAEANGLSAGAQLTGGQSLIIPNKVANIGNTSQTFRPYDPNEALGNLMPTAPKPTKRPGCGMMGQVLIALVAVAVAVVLPELSPFFANGIGAVLGGMIASAASQGVAVATGVQSKFSWKSVAMAGVTAGLTQGLSMVKGPIGAFMTQPQVAGSAILGEVARGAVVGALSQGIGVATGLQHKFSWAGVAAAGAVAGASSGASLGLKMLGVNGLGNQLVSSAASAFTGAGVRALATGTSFGDNINSVLPDVIANAIGMSATDAAASYHAGQAKQPAAAAAESIGGVPLPLNRLPTGIADAISRIGGNLVDTDGGVQIRGVTMQDLLSIRADATGPRSGGGGALPSSPHISAFDDGLISFLGLSVPIFVDTVSRPEWRGPVDRIGDGIGLDFVAEPGFVGDFRSVGLVNDATGSSIRFVSRAEGGESVGPIYVYDGYSVGIPGLGITAINYGPHSSDVASSGEAPLFYPEGSRSRVDYFDRPLSRYASESAARLRWAAVPVYDPNSRGMSRLTTSTTEVHLSFADMPHLPSIHLPNFLEDSVSRMREVAWARMPISERGQYLRDMAEAAEAGRALVDHFSLFPTEAVNRFFNSTLLAYDNRGSVTLTDYNPGISPTLTQTRITWGEQGRYTVGDGAAALITITPWGRLAGMAIGGRTALAADELIVADGAMAWNRLTTVGRTPGKSSPTGRAVIQRMEAEGRIRDDPFQGRMFQASDEEWYPLRLGDMSHNTDAVHWWNAAGRDYGARASEVRQWMLNPDNYTIDLFRINRSAGATLRNSGVRYLPPRR